jgi:hypothetical protein
MRSTSSSLWKTCSNTSRGRAAQFLRYLLLRIRLSRRDLRPVGAAGGGGGDSSGIATWSCGVKLGRLVLWTATGVLGSVRISPHPLSFFFLEKS